MHAGSLDGIYGSGGMNVKIKFDFPRELLVLQSCFFAMRSISAPLMHAGSLHPDESFVEHGKWKDKSKQQTPNPHILFQGAE